jgi:hypothetical protein
MNYLDEFRYSFDNLDEINIKKDVVVIKKKYANERIKTLLSNSVKVSKEIFPNIQLSIDKVFDNLKLKNNFSFFITANHHETQAMCSMMPESNNAEIIITSKMIELLNKEELQSIIGHEVSHFYYQHSLYPSPISAKTRIEQLNYLHLSRAAEISADRAGFLASGNLENSLRAMLKITSGLTDEHINFNYSIYLDQLRELKELKGDKTQMFSTHPTFLNRMQALIWFSMSNEYHQFFETDKKGIYELKEVDKKINDSIKNVTGGEIEKANEEIIEKALLWGALWIFLSDKKFSKKEQEIFSKRFGDKNIISVKSLLKISKISNIEKKVIEAYETASTLLKSDKNKIINQLHEIYTGVDEKNDKTKKELEKIIKFLND